MIYINQKFSIPRSEVSFTFARSPGPGGQNVNKVNSKAVLRWPIEESDALPAAVKQRFLAKFKNRISNDGVLVLASHRFRDQPRNVQDCIEKLRTLVLAVAEAPTPRKKKRVSAGSKRRRLENKRQRSEKKRLRGPVGE